LKKLVLVVNGEPVREYDRGKTLAEGQLAYLDKMDSDMGRGIRIHGEHINAPDDEQRALFIAMTLLRTLQQGNEAAATACFAYLARCKPNLVEIHADDQDDGVHIEFIPE
jgi:hypothetical protein